MVTMATRRGEDLAAPVLGFNDVQPPQQRDRFATHEFGPYLSADRTLIRVVTENSSCYELLVVSRLSLHDLVVAVRCEGHPHLRVPRVASYFQEADGIRRPVGCFEAGTSMVFQYVLPDGQTMEHRSGLIRSGGIALVPAGNTEPFLTALRIFQEAVLPADAISEGAGSLWCVSLLDLGMSPAEVHAIWQAVQTFHSGAQRVLSEVLETARMNGSLRSVMEAFLTLYQAYWSRQPTGERGATEGSSTDLAAFNKLRNLAGMPWAVSVRGD